MRARGSVISAMTQSENDGKQPSASKSLMIDVMIGPKTLKHVFRTIVGITYKTQCLSENEMTNSSHRCWIVGWNRSRTGDGDLGCEMSSEEGSLENSSLIVDILSEEKLCYLLA